MINQSNIPVTRRSVLLGIAAMTPGLAFLSSGCRRSADSSTAQSTRSPSSDEIDADDENRSQRPALPDREPIIRVRIDRIRDEKKSVRIGDVNQRFTITNTIDPNHQRIFDGPLTVRIGPDAWLIRDGHQQEHSFDGLESIDLSCTDKPNLLALNQRTYAGKLVLVARTDIRAGAFDVVNHTPLEAYLPGVLAGELFSHWHFQTFAAQAIAARSYAAAEHDFWRTRRHFDVSSTTSSQVYHGRVKNQRMIQAVTHTRGVVLAYENALVPGYYSSCCGGVAARAVDAIANNPANDIKPLHGRTQPDVCTNAPIYTWRTSRPLQTLTRRFIAFAKTHRLHGMDKLVELRSIEVESRNKHGRPREFRITDTREQSIVLSARNLRRSVNYSGQGLHSPKRSLRSSFTDVVIDNGSAHFRGHGWGHGAGMCQYGAQTLADQGRSHEQIIAWYYPGSQMIRCYG